ncbi:maleylpyruvate isomerase family mycothiol-dependent enzyme [Paenarthrobacter sp. PH39-S1]|uniref:maleylpyruvate isomerase family mycothiol-dependent enzyme n=1 Tax=Paenarthrobacter sp. PH39-S1 TaxID=3046204 RepID=UPI0024BA7A67|nr:maleylpyruvate isomerase family mycothiol-dependent enzyme [Paenarthrobacter sp. PH39-S1]MDJ0357333.1 maleylpyruvate isomerase family mycothiol-dependent enzyme [Paenarthrobacter sp. PH39-S1]
MTEPSSTEPFTRWPSSARISTDELLADLDAAAEILLAKTTALTENEISAPSALPGWTRGHVLAHLRGVANAVARQCEYAAQGESIEFYDGGFEGRTRSIEVAAGNTAAEHLAALQGALNRVLTDLRGLDEAGWQLPITYRNGVVYDGGLALWRELVIHLSDLEVGRGPETWSGEFCSHLFGFLQPRVPAGLRLKLQPLGLPALTLENKNSGGSSVSVSGMLTDLAAWLAGRTPSLGSLRAEAAADAVDLPELLPWPSGVAPK